MAKYRMPSVTLDYLTARINQLKQEFGLTGYESVTDVAVIDTDNNPEYSRGTVLLRLRETGEEERYGTLSIAPERLSEKLN